MTTVVGAFETREMASRAVDALLAEGFAPDQISVLGRHGQLASVTQRTRRRPASLPAPSIGAVAGAALAGVIALAIPGVGPLLALGVGRAAPSGPGRRPDRWPDRLPCLARRAQGGGRALRRARARGGLPGRGSYGPRARSPGAGDPGVGGR